MDSVKIFLILALISSFLVSGACERNPDSPTNSRPGADDAAKENSNSAKTNVEELGLLATIPFQAEDIVWKEDDPHKNLVAVLRFSPADANRIVDDATYRRTPENVILSAETWFPAELIAQSEMSGDDSLRGISYAADGFMQEPFTSGSIVRVDGTDYFVLELSAK